MSTPQRLLANVRDGLAARRAQRQDQARLERELAQFATPTQRQELDAILDRYPADQTRLIRDILDRQDGERRAERLALGTRAA